ncbi:hypothetical protein [Actinopolymorpha rutila]|uniref:DUF3995 domain-containing protein n=1 Tax=Actinopolymorpha rutila TaxID=446787 RepID=A0A852ZK43_9ACTN|nr:hypothetical protein [Actinopolymorpha rutila]NYH93441.1 hypothetical protein [Actinopolymorpha rutila]
MRTATSVPQNGRFGPRPGNLGPRDGRRPPRWAVRTAHLISVILLPSGLWRVAVALGLSMGIATAAGVDASLGLAPGRQAVAILGLTVLSEGVGLLSLGLVRPWGEVFPRWMPLIGGRRVPPVGATVLAASGAIALTAIWTFATVNFFVLTVFGPPGKGFAFVNGWWEALLVLCYLPLLLWGPLLLALTWAYYRRRCRD